MTFRNAAVSRKRSPSASWLFFTGGRFAGEGGLFGGLGECPAKLLEADARREVGAHLFDVFTRYAPGPMAPLCIALQDVIGPAAVGPGAIVLFTERTLPQPFDLAHFLENPVACGLCLLVHMYSYVYVYIHYHGENPLRNAFLRKM